MSEPSGISVVFPPEVEDGSWLRSDDYEDDPDVQNFLAGLSYARTQTNFIAASAGVSAEACFWIWSCIQGGIERGGVSS